MKKIGKLIKRHLVLFIGCCIALIVIIVMLVAFLMMTINTSGRYGDRLDGIKDVEISKSTLSSIAQDLEKKDEVDTAKLRIQGKIIYVDITFASSTSLDKAKAISAEVIDKFDDEERKFYDLEFIINQKPENEESETWSSAGTKNATKDTISWIKS